MEVIMEQNIESQILEQIVRKRVKKIKQFYSHLFIFTIGVIIYILKKYFGLSINFWPIRFINDFFMWCWTFVIVVQGAQLFLSEKILGKNWEEQKIKRILEEEKIEKQNWR